VQCYHAAIEERLMNRPSKSVPPPSADLVDELVTGNRIIFDQKVVDAFGHISVRHDQAPDAYLLARNLAPGLVTARDILTFDLDSNPIGDASGDYYSERYIHGEIYKARPEIAAIVHCHAPGLIPFGATTARLRPIFHMSGFLGAGAGVFDIRDAGGMTDMLIRTPDLGRALAVSLADQPIILMRGHGATMVGGSIKQVVYRAVYAAVNAALQMDALRLGEVTFLDPQEAAKAAAANDRAIERPWALWKRQALG
jgi:ribulose-5-phosphate 4-epimerase/fuculose-1-phosphate aldolase